MCTTAEHGDRVIIPENSCEVPCHHCYEEVEFVFDLDTFLRQADPKHGTTGIDEAPDDIKTKCKIPGIVTDGVTGKVKVFVHRCKRHRDCIYCAGIRAGEFFAWIKGTMDHHEVDSLVEVKLDSDDDYRPYRDKYGSDKVMRMPVDDGIVLLIVKEHEDGDKVITEREIGDYQYLQYISATPEKKRTSGGFKAKEAKDEGEVVEVQVRVMLTDTEDAEIVRKAARLAEAQTKELDPTAETLQEAINIREDAFIGIIRGYGIEPYSLAKQKTIKVPVSRINWRT